MKLLKHPSLLIALFSVFLAVFWQEMSHSYQQEQAPSNFGLITTADGASYTAPPINWYHTGEWKDNSSGPSAWCQRPPGYGFLVLLCYGISNSHYLLLLKIFQVLAFFGSVLLIRKILLALKLSEKWALVAMAVYGLLPCFSSTMYFILTESISPFLVLLTTYQWLLLTREKKNPTWFIIIGAFTLLVRPQLLILILLLSFYLFYKRGDLRKYVLLLFLPLLLWLGRSYSITGQLSLHPIYSSENQSIYRPPHKALTDLFRIWEFRSDEFHAVVAQLAKDTTRQSLHTALDKVPFKYREEVKPTLKAYQLLLHEQKEILGSGVKLKESKAELDFVRETEKLTSELSDANPMDNYVITPIKSGMELLLNSHLHQGVFQEYWRGVRAVEILRYLCLMLIVLSFFLTTLILFFSVPATLKIVSIALITTFLYLMFIQRLNEERYLSPLLPVAFVLGVYLVYEILAKEKAASLRQP